ncbi:MAG: helix-hairpin-helix domain-containing protein [Bacteroidota bacterium]
MTFSLTTDQVGKKADVRVLGNFNDWSWDKGLVMKSKKKGYEATLELPAGAQYEFRYLINGDNWFNDEAADDYNGTPFFSHNCIIVLDEVAVKKATTAKKAAPAKKTAAAKPDDLRKIEGIGPKIAGLLKDDGIATFADLAKASQTKLKAVLTAAGPRYKMHNPTTWPEQAKLAAAGKWEELSTLQDELKGGKR